LVSAREHPAVEVRRRQEADVAVLLPSLQGLTERQRQLFFVFQSTITRHVPDGLSPLLDEDVAQAAAACAETLETASRGVIYEHKAATAPAQRLAAELASVLAQVREQGQVVYDSEAARSLRAIEKGARESHQGAIEGGQTYQQLIARLLQLNPPGDDQVTDSTIVSP